MKTTELNQSPMFCRIKGLIKVENKVEVKEETVKKVKHEKICKIGDKRLCAKCNRKLRLTNSFKCRCGSIYCAFHRFGDKHGCAFDFKTLERKRIEEENPKIMKSKL